MPRVPRSGSSATWPSSPALGKIERCVAGLSYAAGWAGGLVLVAIIGLTLVEVFSRYVLRAPLILSDEFGGYALVAISFLGLAFCAQGEGHIRITFLVERLSTRVGGSLRVLSIALGLAFVAMAAWVCWQFLGDSFARNMRSNSMLMTPLKWPQMAMPIGFTLFALALAVRLVGAIGDWRAGRSVEKPASEDF